jgi:hypothetical protein
MELLRSTELPNEINQGILMALPSSEFLREHYKECYHFEIERKDKVAQRVGIVLVLLTGLASISKYCIESIFSLPLQYCLLPFYALAFAGIVAGCVSLCWVFLTLAKGVNYYYLPKTTAIRDCLVNAGVIKPEDIDRVCADNLASQYCEFAATNCEMNNMRSQYVFEASRYAAISFLLLLLILAARS